MPLVRTAFAHNFFGLSPIFNSIILVASATLIKIAVLPYWVTREGANPRLYDTCVWFARDFSLLWVISGHHFGVHSDEPSGSLSFEIGHSQLKLASAVTAALMKNGTQPVGWVSAAKRLQIDLRRSIRA